MMTTILGFFLAWFGGVAFLVGLFWVCIIYEEERQRQARARYWAERSRQ